MDATLALMAALRALAEQQAFNDALAQRVATLEAEQHTMKQEVADDANPDAVQRSQ